MVSYLSNKVDYNVPSNGSWVDNNNNHKMGMCILGVESGKFSVIIHNHKILEYMIYFYNNGQVRKI